MLPDTGPLQTERFFLFLVRLKAMRILIKNGHVIDPAARVDSRQDLLVEDGRVAAVGLAAREAESRAEQVIDAEGRIVCPGFIDIHMHEDPVTADGTIDAYSNHAIFPCMLRMGVTTAVAGNCGENKYHPADYLDLADRDGVPVNVAMLAGHEFFRHQAGCTYNYAAATKEQKAEMAREMEKSLERGCVGLSYGIRYVPGMDIQELLETAAGAAKHGKLVAAHIRDDADFVFDAAREFLDAGLRLGVPMEVSHIGSMAGFGQMEAFLRLIDSYRLLEPRIGCDCYPYAAFSTNLGSATYDEGWRERYQCGYDAVELAEGKYKGQRCTKEIFDETRRDFPACMTICYVMRQDEVDLAYSHPGVMVGSDGTLSTGQGHPRASGAFPRVLSRYVGGGKLSLYDAIERMTALPAKQLGLSGKGSLSVGKDADIVIFDPEKIRDTASFEDPLSPPVGIDWVFVNGIAAAKDGKMIDDRAGRAVRT